MKKLLLIISIFFILYGCQQSNSNYTKPNLHDILNDVKLLVNEGDKALIFNENLIGNIDTVELFSVDFSGKKGEYLAMGYSSEEHYPCMSFCFYLRLTKQPITSFLNYHLIKENGILIGLSKKTNLNKKT